MPDLTPPPGAERDPYTLLLWIAGIAVLAVVALFGIMLKREDVRDARHLAERQSYRDMVSSQFEKMNADNVQQAVLQEKLSTLIAAALEKIK